MLQVSLTTEELEFYRVVNVGDVAERTVRMWAAFPPKTPSVSVERPAKELSRGRRFSSVVQGPRYFLRGKEEFWGRSSGGAVPSFFPRDKRDIRSGFFVGAKPRCAY